MKKFLATMIAAMSLSVAYALPMGNPTAASIYTNGIWCEGSDYNDPCDPCFSWCGAWSIRLGYYGDFVYNRNLEVDGSFQGGANQSAFCTTLTTNAALITLNICDRLDIFTTLGASTLTVREAVLRDIGGIFSFEGLHDDVYATDFSWSIGGRLTLWECGCFGLGFEGQYFNAKTQLTAFEYTPFPVVNFDLPATHYQEWQLGLGASYAFTIRCPSIALIPYLGITYAQAKLGGAGAVPVPLTVLEDFQVVPNWKSAKPWSLVVGTTFTLCDVVGISVEGRFAGESALHVNGEFRF